MGASIRQVHQERGGWPRTRLILLAILGLTFILHLLVIAEPFGQDQGIFAYIGQTILRGGVPYRDAFDHKTPALYAVYAVAFALFGPAMSSVHLFEGIALTLGTFVLFLTGRRLNSASVGLLAGLLYGASATLLFEWWDRGQAEVYMGLAGALAAYFLVRAYGVRSDGVRAYGALAYGRAAATASIRCILAGGVFCGLTLLFKPSGFPLPLGLGLAIVLLSWAGGVRHVCRDLAALGGGLILSLIPMLAYFAWKGAFEDLYQAVIVFNTYHARIGGNPTLAGSATGTLDFLMSMNILAPLAAVGLWLLWATRSGPGAVPVQGQAAAGRAAPVGTEPQEQPPFPVLGRIVLPIWLVASAAGIWTQGKFFSYHWSPVVPPLSLLAAWGLAGLAHESQKVRTRATRLAVAALGLVVIAIYAAALVHDHAPKWVRDANYLLGRTSEDAYLANFAHNIQERDKYSFLETKQAAQYVRQHSSPDDTVLVWGFQALLNYLADRRAPTRYIFTYPLTFNRPESAFRVQARRTFLQDLNTHSPLYIVLVTNDVNPLQAVDSYSLLPDFPELQQILQQHYRLETDIGEFHMYRRIDA
jgi:hypothetical protein